LLKYLSNLGIVVVSEFGQIEPYPPTLLETYLSPAIFGSEVESQILLTLIDEDYIV
jgi:hypothetical protein